LRNFSRNRPETTNLSHQYAIRRVFICPVLDAGIGPGRIQPIAPNPAIECDMLHTDATKPTAIPGQVEPEGEATGFLTK
jgi:hypothetical protein